MDKLIALIQAGLIYIYKELKQTDDSDLERFQLAAKENTLVPA
jgi:hypothetical protein